MGVMAVVVNDNQSQYLARQTFLITKMDAWLMRLSPGRLLLQNKKYLFFIQQTEMESH